MCGLQYARRRRASGGYCSGRGVARTSKDVWFSLVLTRGDGVGVLPILRRRLPGPRLRPAAPQVPLVAIRVRLLPAPGRRREHDQEHAHIDLPEPVPLLEAPRREDDLRGCRAVTGATDAIDAKLKALGRRARRASQKRITRRG